MFVLVLGTALFAPTQALLAQNAMPVVPGVQSSNSGGATGIITNPLKFDNVLTLLTEVMRIFVQVATIIAAFFIIYSGFLFVSARGNTGQVEKAKKIFFDTIIGSIIILGAFVIIEVIDTTVKQFTN